MTNKDIWLHLSKVKGIKVNIPEQKWLVQLEVGWKYFWSRGQSSWLLDRLSCQYYQNFGFYSGRFCCASLELGWRRTVTVVAYTHTLPVVRVLSFCAPLVLILFHNFLVVPFVHTWDVVDVLYCVTQSGHDMPWNVWYVLVSFWL